MASIRRLPPALSLAEIAAYKADVDVIITDTVVIRYSKPYTGPRNILKFSLEENL